MVYIDQFLTIHIRGERLHFDLVSSFLLFIIIILSYLFLTHNTFVVSEKLTKRNETQREK